MPFFYPAAVFQQSAFHHFVSAIHRSLSVSERHRLLGRDCVRRSPAGHVALLLVLCCAGCQTNSRQAALEEQLRGRETKIRELQDQLAINEKLLVDQDRELSVARQSGPQSPGNGLHEVGQVSRVSQSTEQQLAWGSVAAIQLHKLTSGLVMSPTPGETVLNLVLQPLDDDNELVKVAGELKVTASITTADGGPREVLQRTFSLTDSRQLWSRALVSSGFHLTLPIPVDAEAEVRSADDILVTASLNLGPGRVYSCSELISND